MSVTNKIAPSYIHAGTRMANRLDGLQSGEIGAVQSHAAGVSMCAITYQMILNCSAHRAENAELKAMMKQMIKQSREVPGTNLLPHHQPP